MRTTDACLRLLAALPGTAADPLQPLQLTVRLAGATQVVSWSSPVSAGSSGFQLDRYDGEGLMSSRRRTVYTGPATEFSDTVEIGRSYTYELTAIDVDGVHHGAVRAPTVATAPTVTAPVLVSDGGATGTYAVSWGSTQNAPDTVYEGPLEIAGNTARTLTVRKDEPGTVLYDVVTTDRYDNAGRVCVTTVVPRTSEQPASRRDGDDHARPERGRARSAPARRPVPAQRSPSRRRPGSPEDGGSGSSGTPAHVTAGSRSISTVDESRSWTAAPDPCTGGHICGRAAAGPRAAGTVCGLSPWRTRTTRSSASTPWEQPHEDVAHCCAGRTRRSRRRRGTRRADSCIRDKRLGEGDLHRSLVHLFDHPTGRR